MSIFISYTKQIVLDLGLLLVACKCTFYLYHLLAKGDIMATLVHRRVARRRAVEVASRHPSFTQTTQLMGPGGRAGRTGSRRRRGRVLSMWCDMLGVVCWGG